METLSLTPEGEILEKGRPAAGDPLSWLSRLVTLEEGVTLSSFFSMVRSHSLFIQLSPVLDPLIQMAEAAGPSYPKAEELDGLVFYKTVAMKGFPGRPGIEIYNSLKGVKAGEVLGLKFFQVESLLEHDLHLGDLKHVIFGDSQDMFTCDTHYSLFELIDGVAWEMSFNFNPLQCSIRG